MFKYNQNNLLFGSFVDQMYYKGSFQSVFLMHSFHFLFLWNVKDSLRVAGDRFDFVAFSDISRPVFWKFDSHVRIMFLKQVSYLHTQ